VAGVIQVASIDNDRLVPAALRAMLAGHPDIELVHACTSVPDYLRSGSGADVVLLDLALEDGSLPAENVRALRSAEARVLVLSVHGRRHHVWATIGAGAAGYLIKDDDADQLVEAIRAVCRGEMALTTDLIGMIVENPPPLSDQEHEALRLYGTGSTLAATARRMGISISTVRSYLERISDKWAAAGEPGIKPHELHSVYHPPPR
jgi:DNA-binding NarL/FixJ family response regulator